MNALYGPYLLILARWSECRRVLVCGYRFKEVGVLQCARDDAADTGHTHSRPWIEQLGVNTLPFTFPGFRNGGSAPLCGIGRRPVLVKVQQRVRYAVHKLIVSQERAGTERMKIQKNLLQTWEIVRALKDIDPKAFYEALESVRSRGAGWRKRVDNDLIAMTERFDKKENEWEKNV